MSQDQKDLIDVMRKLVEQEQAKAQREEAKAQLEQAKTAFGGQPGYQAFVDNLMRERTNFWQQFSGTAGGALGGPLTQVLQSAGLGGLSGVTQGVGGLLSGNPTAALQGGVQAVSQAVQDTLAPTIAAQRSYAASQAGEDPFRTPEFVNELSKRRSEVDRIKAEDTFTAREGYALGAAIFDPARPGESWFDAFNRHQREFSEDIGERARAAQGRVDELRQETNVEQQVSAFFAPFAVGGGRPGRDDIRQITDFYKRQQDAIFAMNRDIHAVVSEAYSPAPAPGSAGIQGKR